MEGSFLVMGWIWILRIRGFGFGFEFQNPRIRIRILSLDNIFEMISLPDKKRQNSHHSHIDKIHRLFANKNNKSDKLFQNNSISI